MNDSKKGINNGWPQVKYITQEHLGISWDIDLVIHLKTVHEEKRDIIFILYKIKSFHKVASVFGRFQAGDVNLRSSSIIVAF